MPRNLRRLQHKQFTADPMQGFKLFYIIGRYSSGLFVHAVFPLFIDNTRNIKMQDWSIYGNTNSIQLFTLISYEPFGLLRLFSILYPVSCISLYLLLANMSYEFTWVAVVLLCQLCYLFILMATIKCCKAPDLM